MGHRKKRIQPRVNPKPSFQKSEESISVIDPLKFGVSLSLKQCRNFNIDIVKTLQFLLTTVGLRRFRLMSYWNEHEPQKGVYDFSQLDAQINLIEQYCGVITLCLGARQPRWPESHYPDWALELPQHERYAALYTFISEVVNRYKNRDSIVSWQLENEALNRGFGENGDFNRKRLIAEFQLVKSLDKSRPIIMTTSNTWGLPIRMPRPGLFGFTFYRIQYTTKYKKSKLPWWWYNIRAFFIAIFTGRASFVHELQAEPWGPKAICEMSMNEQNKSMSIDQLKSNVLLAKKTSLYPIDLWGGEWWYWLYKNGDQKLIKAIQKLLT